MVKNINEKRFEYDIPKWSLKDILDKHGKVEFTNKLPNGDVVRFIMKYHEFINYLAYHGKMYDFYGGKVRIYSCDSCED